MISINRQYTEIRFLICLQREFVYDCLSIRVLSRELIHCVIQWGKLP